MSPTVLDSQRAIRPSKEARGISTAALVSNFISGSHQRQVPWGFNVEHIAFRSALLSDVPAIVALLADDPLGSQREITGTPLDQRYVAAFQAIEADANQCLAVVVDNDEVIGTLQISFIPGIARMGAWRGQIEAVRVARLQSRSAHDR
jgi:hypothetical protein